jgi:hypothetical protein
VGAGAMHELGPLLRASQGEAMPVAHHVRSSDLGAKVQPLHDRSNRRDDWHALLPRYRRCDAGPFFWRHPRRLGSLVARRKFALLKGHKTYWSALGHEADLLRLLPRRKSAETSLGN